MKIYKRSYCIYEKLFHVMNSSVLTTKDSLSKKKKDLEYKFLSTFIIQYIFSNFLKRLHERFDGCDIV